MNTLFEQLNPSNRTDIFWSSGATKQLLPRKVHIITEKFNTTPYQLLHTPLKKRIKIDATTGIVYALLQSENDSKDAVVVHFNPFANGLTENMLLRGEYCRQVFKSLEVTDDAGKTLSMITFAAPGSGATIKLSKTHCQRTAQGRFDNLAAHYLNIVKQLGYHQILVIGFSQGASIATAAAAIAPNVGLKATHLAIGEPANVLKRTRTRLMKDFVIESKHLTSAIKASGIKAFETAHQNESVIKYILAIASKPRLHHTLLKGLSKNSFVYDLRETIKHGTRVTIGYGDLTSIRPPAVMRSIVNDTRREFTSNPKALYTVEIQNARHAWADRLDLLAVFYAYALMR